MQRLVRSSRVSNTLPTQLLPHPRGSLDSLVAFTIDMTNLLEGGAVIAVRAVGMNFRDVLNVLDMYPGDPGPPGGDFSGVVMQLSSDAARDGFADTAGADVTHH